MTVDTGKVQDRRALKFDSLQEILDDVERLNQGPMRTLGNWSGGQILRHLTIALNASVDGVSMHVPLHMRIFGRMISGWILKKGMSAGFLLKGPAADALVPPPTTWEEGLAGFRKAIGRLQADPHRAPRHPLLGPLAPGQWDRLHCRHAELHLSFLIPASE
jgi:hypothetical protein